MDALRRVKHVWDTEYWKSTTQFVFRGYEQEHGRRALEETKANRQDRRRERNFGGDTQLIYPRDDMVKWSELQVWIGVHQPESTAFSIFECPAGYEDSHRGTRLARPYTPTFECAARWMPSDEATQAARSSV